MEASTVAAAHSTISRRVLRLYEVFPLLCPSCGAPMRIIAFIAPIPRRPVRSWTTSVSLPHHHRSPPPAARPARTARRRPGRIRAGDPLRSIPSPITTTIKAFHGDRRQPCVIFPRERHLSARQTLVRWQILPSGARFYPLEPISTVAKGLDALKAPADTSPDAVGFPSLLWSRSRRWRRALTP
jgi:hypothetical protein